MRNDSPITLRQLVRTFHALHLSGSVRTAVTNPAIRNALAACIEYSRQRPVRKRATGHRHEHR